TLDQGPDVSEAPPSEAPPTEAPPTEAPPTEAPPTEAPPTEAPPASFAPSGGVGDATDAPGATLSSTDTEGIVAGPRGTDLKSMFMLLAVLCFLVASIMYMTPAPSKAKASGRN
ncbi:MAG TPA: hypothetical protein VGM49_03075, partial [Candidatus Limnocylindrales bacterium]